MHVLCLILVLYPVTWILDLSLPFASPVDRSLVRERGPDDRPADDL